MNQISEMKQVCSDEVPTRIRVMVADDHQMVRQSLVSLLEKQPDFEVVAVASNGEEAINLAISDKPVF